MKRLAPLFLLLTACATTPATKPCHSGLALVNASAWFATAAEYRANALQTYATARTLLDQALATPDDRPAAIILDLDETTLDNAAFEGRMIRRGITYDQKAWEEWVGESAATAIPGAKEFLDYAQSRGVTPFYITNRKKKEEEAATRRNLQRLGFPLQSDSLLTRTDTRDKTMRRDSVASRYRVLLVLGDDLNDFVFADGKSIEERRHLVESNRSNWGTRWLILPNPMYGSWEKALTGDSPECEGLQKKIEAVRP